ncbi:MAG: alpha/beta hydrolase [Flavobacteriaceae bacterium CG2_30_34_30]|nr:MAG: alpha/beta hydrolase [Flavobacteriaceae bacterium CG2_30_34_30]PIQ18335.1 MAG: alpha/beta hydrolase [Flavobacteriaceae bacterium CG18_big_fil_WC_8_21_14_2_50_34_36]PIZ08159.1 MAG: alpha/beta hydrolase [Flavobacteriaceae bacterium CG_4_10_14_0_8_um_filter_34_31]PJC06370.1 MAG: alpha/beta hydrolase [Flavobacteriaceae bacterium CG_4_9_14_0_8_um_filter_34_30]
MKSYILILITFLIVFNSFSQNKTYKAEEIKINNLIDGLLLVPENEETSTLAILIQGSGPTDRNGNQPMVNNNSLKYLAEGLSNRKIATFRYDKRLVNLARQGRLKEENIVFDDFIKDAMDVTAYFKKDPRFSKIVIIGHSEGSLVGMVTAQENRADAFISIAGAGQEIDDVIVDQLERQAPALKEDARNSFDDLRVNGIATNYGEGLSSIFRPSVQPFMRTWMAYNPQKEIAKLNIPVFIINGNQDIQVDENEAKLLKEAKPDAELLIIEGMNHIFKKITPGDTMENAKSYNEPNRKVMPELIETIENFIKALD